MARRKTTTTKPAAAALTVGPASAAARVDSWKNAVTGLGTNVDPLTRATFASNRTALQNPQNLENLYYEDDLVQKVVDKIIAAAMRQGWGIELRADDGQDQDAEQVKARSERILARARSLETDARIVEACRWGRLYGGGAVFIGADQGDPSTPLNPRAPGRIQFLTTLERQELMPSAWSVGLGARNFGKVDVWSFYPQGMAAQAAMVPKIHSSRLLTFEGLPVSKHERMAQSGWSLSVLAPVIEVIRDAQQNWRSVGLILAQAHQAVFKMKNLVEMISNGNAADLQRRMEVVNLMRSISRAILVDADAEAFDYHSASLSGLDVIMDKTWQRLAAAADMPVTTLMGTSPAGLNATGESDVRQWYDNVAAYRSTQIEPQLERLVRIIAAEVGDPNPSAWCVTWPSLWQMSPTEEATYRKTIADTDSVYIDKGVLEPEEVTASRFGSGGWSAETYVDLGLRKATAGSAKPDDEAAAYPAQTAGQAPPAGAGEPQPSQAKQSAQTAPESAPGGGVTPPELAKDPTAALNGAQVASLMEIVSSVATRAIPRENGIELILAAFPLQREQAEKVMGSIGKTFFSETPA